MNKTAMCTICSYNYLSFGINACLSVKEYNPAIDVFLLIVDKKDDSIALLSQQVINYLYVDDLTIDQRMLTDMEFKYNIIEFNTAVKPTFLRYLFSKGYEKALYFDPDVMCFNSLDYLKTQLDEYSVVLSPHRLTIYDSKIIDDSAFLNNGIFNLGFIALKNDKTGNKILTWWEKKLENGAFLNYQAGLATDQLWCNLIPVYFDDVLISRNPGLNVSYWNLEERKIDQDDKGQWIVNDQKLLFYHFSGYTPDFPDFINRKLNLKVAEFDKAKKIFMYYHDQVQSYNYENYRNIPYSFSVFDNGFPITPIHRQIYQELKSKDIFIGNPFEAIGKHSYFRLLRSLKIHKVGMDSGDNESFKIDNTSSKRKKSLLRVALRIIGLRNLIRFVQGAKFFSLIRILKGYF